MTALLDGEGRKRAIEERDRNVIVDASAGTGKTSLVVNRIVQLIAPPDGIDPIPIDRIAAITFTRKAAGELRVRTRQAILTALALLPNDDPRSTPLYRALGGIDTAHIGTIHSFADRLLRKFPAQARLDPRYELEDDLDKLSDECFQWLIDGAQQRSLRDALQGSGLDDRCDEVVGTVLDAQRAGIPMRSVEGEHWTYHGLQGLVRGFVLQRDVEVKDPAFEQLDRRSFERYADELLALIDGLSVETLGGRWLADTGRRLRRALTESDPAALFHEVVAWLERGPRGRASDAPRFKSDFGSDARAWKVWKALLGDDGRDPLRDGSLRDDLLGPLRRWFAIRLARTRPVVLALYEGVKARHQAVDQVDLLLRLRDLLRDDRSIRRSCQGLFDHIFVDEFQDTDPLQAEVVLFLCEHGCAAKAWHDVKVGMGRLTIVGDPKQSIYRFRRADIGTYQRVVEIVERQPHLHTQLKSSYRSTPGLIDWINDRFAQILGVSDTGQPFRRETGEVFYQPLSPGPRTGADPSIHAVAADLDDDCSATEYRTLEAEVTARYLRWLVERSGIQIEDRFTRERRSIAYGDIGVLAVTTSNLRVLFHAFDADGVPYAARGGTVFMSDPVQRQFLLGLCAIADRDDGVAFAALMRPPFFAIDLPDVARSNADDPNDLFIRAREIVTDLRRHRFDRGPGSTARALLEQTAFARCIALGPNGRQRLSSLREVCFQLEAFALSEGLDFDGAVERIRPWIESPRRVDRPHPVGGEAVRVMTIHQAKGLEFPVVVLWDSRGTWKERVTHEPWTVDRETHGWALRVEHVHWEDTTGIEEREREMRAQERKRLVYVAATRARDLLVVPKIGEPDNDRIFGKLLGTRPSPTVLTHPVHKRSAHAAWFDAAMPPSPGTVRGVTDRDMELQQLLAARGVEASRARMRPVAFTDAASPRMLWNKKGRFGAVFGETVHLAIGLVLERGESIESAVTKAAAAAGLSSNLGDAVVDVARTVATLAQLGLRPGGRDYSLEYPIAGVNPRGELVAGYIDLVASRGDDMTIIDFKTDVPPGSPADISPRYRDQVLGYAGALGVSLQTPSTRAGLLFTADGVVRWLTPGDNAGA